MKEERKWQPYMVMLLSTILFGFSFLAEKNALVASNNDIISLLAFRFLIAAIVFVLLRIFGIIKTSFKGKQKKELLLLCFFSPIVAFSAEAIGISMTKSAEAGIIIALIPIVTILFNYLYFKEKISLKRGMFVLISILGIAFINVLAYQSGSSSNWGRLLMILMVLGISLYMVYTKKVSGMFSPVEITYAMMIIGAVVFNAASVIRHLINGTMQLYFAPLFVPGFFIWTLYLALGISLIGYFCMNNAIPKLSVPTAAVMTNLSPIISIIVGVVFLNESLAWYHFVGAVAIIGGVLGATLINIKEEK